MASELCAVRFEQIGKKLLALCTEVSQHLRFLPRSELPDLLDTQPPETLEYPCT